MTRRHSLRWALATAALLLAAMLAALGVWQVERRAWKHALITAVEQRVNRPPMPAPLLQRATPQHEYRRVQVSGRFDHERETLVRAVSDLGSGYWVLTPLVTPRFTVLVNRGFVPPARATTASRAPGNPAGEVTVTGLLRLSEPGGAFLRDNDPVRDRWFSRDVAAIATARGVRDAAPYFIDADATANAGGWPVGGLTVLRFSDNHFIYALTWFTLSALALFAAWRVTRDRKETAA